MKHPEFVISVVLTIATVFIIAVWVQGDASLKLKLTFEYGLLTILFLLGFLILAAIASGKIDISSLLAESGGGASMSRFQLLIFTFVIAVSFFLVVVGKNSITPDTNRTPASQNNSPADQSQLPTVPSSVLVLLGISAGTYGVSKGIQAAGALPGKSATTKPDDSTPASNKPSGS